MSYKGYVTWPDNHNPRNLTVMCVIHKKPFSGVITHFPIGIGLWGDHLRSIAHFLLAQYCTVPVYNLCGINH